MLFNKIYQKVQFVFNSPFLQNTLLSVTTTIINMEHTMQIDEIKKTGTFNVSYVENHKRSKYIEDVQIKWEGEECGNGREGQSQSAHAKSLKPFCY